MRGASSRAASRGERIGEGCRARGALSSRRRSGYHSPMLEAPRLGGRASLLSPLLGTLERVTWVQRHLFPPLADRLASELAPRAALLSAPLRAPPAREGPGPPRR